MLITKNYPSPVKSQRQTDLVLATLPANTGRSPEKTAAAYCVIAIVSTVVAACIEGLFIRENRVEWGGSIFLIHPFCHNFSTLLDFAILNPVMILYVLRARARIKSAAMPIHSGVKEFNYAQSILCLAVAATAIALYFQGFLHGSYFDAVVAIRADGSKLITVTGWLVFFWTTLILYFLLSGVVVQSNYVLGILRLRIDDIVYDPFHEDQVGGLKKYADPTLDFMKAMVALFIAFAVFLLYDFIVFQVHESKRVWALAVYATVVFPLFLVPVIHLHRLMKAHQRRIMSQTLIAVKGKECALPAGSVRSFKELSEELAAIRDLSAWISSTPSWPLPMGTLLRTGTYMLGVLTPLVPKVLPTILSAMGLKSP